MGVGALSLAIGASAGFAIWPPNVTLAGLRLVYILKPLTLLLILALALTASSRTNRRRAVGVGAGLLCSLAGDVFLMLPGDLFLPGLASFFAAHVCYLVAFTSDSRLARRRLPFLIAAVAGVILLILLWPGVPSSLRLPVVLYAVALLGLTAQAASRALELKTLPAMLAGLGAVLFTCSDAVLAINRFRFSFAGAHTLILSTYYLGQWLIALSTAEGANAGRPDPNEANGITTAGGGGESTISCVAGRSPSASQ